MNTDFARQQMIEQQVRAWDVLDPRVLRGLADIPREKFVPPQFEALAFADTEIPLGHGQRMMTPTIEGRVLQSLDLDGSEKVLEIGTGSGFMTACLAKLAAHVTSLEIYADLLDQAQQVLTSCAVENIDLQTGDATQELPDEKFDAIAVTGSIQAFDQRFADALAPGGRLFVVVGNAPAMTALRVTRIGEDEWQTDTLFETRLAPLVNGALPPQFSF